MQQLQLKKLHLWNRKIETGHISYWCGGKVVYQSTFTTFGMSIKIKFHAHYIWNLIDWYLHLTTVFSYFNLLLCLDIVHSIDELKNIIYNHALFNYGGYGY